jgi:hypothetical protein
MTPAARRCHLPAETITMSFLRLIAVCLALLALPRTSLAHHSFAMYDSEKLLLLDGTIKEFQWTNPHAIVWVTGSTSPGEPPELWTVELPTSPGNLTRMGWKRTSLSPGDRVVIEINPLRDGRRGGSFKKATLTSTGAVLVAAARDEPPGAAGSAAHADKDHDEEHEHEHEHEKHDSCSLTKPGSGCSAGCAPIGLIGLVVCARRLLRARRPR